MKALCYLNPAKSNNREMLTAFSQGSGAELTERMELAEGRPAVFYGVDPVTLPLWRVVQEKQHPYFYIDNGYFKSKWHGGGYYRITHNAPQCSGTGESNGERWRALGLKIKPWQKTGTHILIACQTDFWHMRHGQEGAAKFAAATMATLRQYTDRKIIVRGKPIKGHIEPPLEQQLADCWAVVVDSSMVALEAVLRGIPVFVLARSALHPVASDDLAKIETPFYAEDRGRWASVLADNQFTLEEMKNGMAWKILHA